MTGTKLPTLESSAGEPHPGAFPGQGQSYVGGTSQHSLVSKSPPWQLSAGQQASYMELCYPESGSQGRVLWPLDENQQMLGTCPGRAARGAEYCGVLLQLDKYQERCGSASQPFDPH